MQSGALHVEKHYSAHLCLSPFPLQMLTINLEESDCFAAWISVTDVPGLEPKIIDGKGMDTISTESNEMFLVFRLSVDLSSSGLNRKFRI